MKCAAEEMTLSLCSPLCVSAMLEVRGPGAQIVPSPVGGNAEDVRALLSGGGARLENAVIHALVLALGIEPAQGLVEFASAPGGGDFFQQRRGLRQILPQGVHQRLRRPEKHAAVPVEISGRDELLGALPSPAFRESCARAMTPPLIVDAGLDVSVSGLGAGGLDAHDDDVFSGRGQRDAGLQILAELLLILRSPDRRETVRAPPSGCGDAE